MILDSSPIMFYAYGAGRGIASPAHRNVLWYLLIAAVVLWLIRFLVQRSLVPLLARVA